MNVAIVGLGLIGGSMAKSIKNLHQPHRLGHGPERGDHDHGPDVRRHRRPPDGGEPAPGGF